MWFSSRKSSVHTVSSKSLMLRALSLVSLTIFIAPSAKAGTIKVCAKSAENNNVALNGANVKCWDDDYNNDDYMTQGTLGSDGCATLTYKTKTNGWWNCNAWDGCGWWSNPDIYCEVSGECLRPTFTTTKDNHNQKYTANFGTIYVPTDADFCEDTGGWNGCGPSVLPDFLTDIASDVYDFRDACNSHDVCYDDCTKNRSECEQNFISDMYNECEGDFLCEFTADLFQGGTDQFGESFCTEAREKIGCSDDEIADCKR